jgi:hypothetical protein
MRSVFVLWALVACGDDGSVVEESGAPTQVVTSLAATPTSPSDVVVARVAGRPVYASCVQAQAVHARTAKAALDECIAFELLAQAAEARGYAEDDDVIDATRTALASRVVETGYEATHQRAETLEPYLSQVMQRDRRPDAMPELRASAYARVNLAKTATPADEAAAKAVIEAIAAELAGQDGLMGPDLATAVKHHQGKPPVVYADVKPLPAQGLETNYAQALFSIDAVGHIAGPVRTAFGYDVVLLTNIEPAFTLTREMREANLVPELRRQVFDRWVKDIEKAAGTQIEMNPEQVLAILAENPS